MTNTVLITILLVVFIFKDIIDIGVSFHDKQTKQQLVNLEKSLLLLQDQLKTEREQYYKEREQYYKRYEEYEATIKRLLSINAELQKRLEND